MPYTDQAFTEELYYALFRKNMLLVIWKKIVASDVIFTEHTFIRTLHEHIMNVDSYNSYIIKSQLFLRECGVDLIFSEKCSDDWAIWKIT